MRAVGLVVAGIAIGGVVVGLAIFALRSDTTIAPPIPDRVVGAVKKCTVVGNGIKLDLEGDKCGGGDKAVAGASVINTRLELTVRTSSGTTYSVTTAPTTNVSVGDPWPKP